MKRYKYYYTTLLILMAVLFAASAGDVTPKEKREPGSRCFSCHPEVQKKVFSQIAHLPAEKGECVKCHNPHTSNYEKLLIEESSNLCYRCHQKKKKEFIKGYIHQPVEKGECVKCHNPHASKNKNILIEGKKDICFTCHKKEKIFSRKNIHQPLKKGDCLKCHNAHASDDEFLLVRDGKEICISCHSVKDQKLRKAHSNYLSEITNCLGCHNPHSSNHDALRREFSHKPFAVNKCDGCHISSANKFTLVMNKKGKALCISCHKDIEKQFQKVFSHIQGNRDNTCLECHNPHASDKKGLKRTREDKLCYSCHTDTKRRVKGKDPMYKYKHHDIEKCTDCHQPHGSDYRLLLTSDENSSCEKCHETQGKFTHPVGDDSIDPRSKRGITCITCHNPMGAEDEYSIRFGRKKKLCVQCHKYKT